MKKCEEACLWVKFAECHKVSLVRQANVICFKTHLCQFGHFFNKLGRKLWLTWNVTFKREAESAFLDGNATIQTPNMICSFIIFYTDLHKAKAIQNTATTFKNSGSPPISSLFPGHEFAQELYDKSRCPAKNVFWRRSLQRCDATQKNSEHLAEAAW